MMTTNVMILLILVVLVCPQGLSGEVQTMKGNELADLNKTDVVPPRKLHFAEHYLQADFNPAEVSWRKISYLTCVEKDSLVKTDLLKHQRVKSSSFLEGTKQSKEIGLKVRAREKEEMVTSAKTAQLYGMTTHTEEEGKMSTPLICSPCYQIKVNSQFTMTLR